MTSDGVQLRTDSGAVLKQWLTLFFVEGTPFFVYVTLLAVLGPRLVNLVVDSVPVRYLFKPLVVEGMPRAFNLKGLFLFYAMPFFFALLVGLTRRERMRDMDGTLISGTKTVYLTSLLWLVPFFPLLFTRTAWTNAGSILGLGHVFILIPAVAAVGVAVSMIGLESKLTFSQIRKRFEISDLALLALIIVGFLAFKLVLFSKFNYPVGADAYYHTALSIRISQGASPFSNPVLYGLPNMYPPLSHIIVAVLSRITGISVIRLWPLFDAFCEMSILISVFYFSDFFSRNSRIAVITVLLVLTWDEVMFDISSRKLALALVPLLWVFLVKWSKTGRKRFILAAILMLIAIGFAHHFVGIVALTVTIAYFVFLNLSGRVTKLWKKLRSISSRAYRHSGLAGLDSGRKRLEGSPYGLLAPLAVLAITIVAVVFRADLVFSTVGTQYFGETLMSLTRPWGTITLLIVPIGILGMVFAYKGDREKRSFTFAILPLLLLSLVYLTKIGILYPKLGFVYQRVAVEVAGIVLALVSATVIYKGFFEKRASLGNLAYWAGIVLVAALVLTTFIWEVELNFDYGNKVQLAMNSYRKSLDMVAEVDPNAVILVDPNDYFDRYIAGVAGRYIFIARYEEQMTSAPRVQGRAVPAGESRTTPIIPTFGSSLMGFGAELRSRIALAEEYWKGYTNMVLLDQLRSTYRVTHVLVVNSDRERNRFYSQNARFTKTGESDMYTLYLINP